ncbi:unnamed protein product, partial [marine sediment metagenome]
MSRFYIAPDVWNPQALVLTAEEAHHLSHVLRMTVG